MKLLYLVTRPRPFFNNQVKVLRDSGHSITVLEVPGRKAQTDSRSLFDYIKYYPKVLCNSLDKYDIIHANFGNTLPFAVLQPIRPLVVTFWGSDLMGRSGTIFKSLARGADEVILPSSVMTNHYENNHTVIPFGVNASIFHPIDKNEAREALGWNPKSNIVLFPYAKTRKVKNYPLARRTIAEATHNIELKTIHDVDYSQVPLYMNASDLVLITSKRESGPMVVKEAALCSVPIVSTNVGFVEDVLVDVTNSFVCTTHQELTTRVEQVLTSTERADGRSKLIEDVSLETMRMRLCDVYERALE